eukprot:GHRR01014144.1.p1 GENE.GHRR01014144.1~~GHRR01014144.1.p1  ORF type:complete len:132 (+),score=45.15 GHRR01014144.1:325-720(+)
MSHRSGPRATNAEASRARKPAPATAQLEQLIIQNPQNFKNNAAVVYFLRIYMTIVAGAAAGILGVEGLGGFLVYLFSQLLCIAPILVKCAGNYRKFFPSWDKVVLEHVFSSTAILSYILFWMIFYNICHVF